MSERMYFTCDGCGLERSDVSWWKEDLKDFVLGHGKVDLCPPCALRAVQALQDAIPHVQWDVWRVDQNYRDYLDYIERERPFVTPPPNPGELHNDYMDRIEKARAEHFDIPSRMTGE